MTTLWNDLKEDLKPSKILVATFTSSRIDGEIDTFVGAVKLTNLELLKEKCLTFASEEFEIDKSQISIRWNNQKDGILNADVYLGNDGGTGYRRGSFDISEYELE